MSAAHPVRNAKAQHDIEASKNDRARAAADFFHGEKPDLAAIGKGDYSGFMAWRERHGADVVLPDAERVRSCLPPSCLSSRSEYRARSSPHEVVAQTVILRASCSS